MKATRSVLFLMTLLLLTGCVWRQPAQTQCQHSYISVVSEPAYGFKEGTMTYTCEKCGDSHTKAIAATNTVKILLIGNSYSMDSSAYLWNVLTQAGMVDVTVAIAYIGGSTLDQHWSNIQGNKESYTYYKNAEGNFDESSGKALLEILRDEPWDIITVQQQSASSCKPKTFGNLDGITSWINENAVNPNAKIYWNMTWSHPSISTDAVFRGLCHGDRQEMYEMIVNNTQEIILPDSTFAGIIPTGTMVQNLSKSYLTEDELYRDELHLSYGYGRYAAALLWYGYIFDGDVDQVEWIPLYLEYVAKDLPVIREAVKNALENPFVATQCQAERVEE